eukprot:9490669-Pyramimonas_sp.AAC.1
MTSFPLGRSYLAASLGHTTDRKSTARAHARIGPMHCTRAGVTLAQKRRYSEPEMRTRAVEVELTSSADRFWPDLA